MTELRGATALRPGPIRPRLGRSAVSALPAWPWRPALTVFAVAAATVAVWATVRADFLAYPYWLAVQKADFILGPIGVGLYWMHFRPANRLGPLLILLGVLGVPYMLQSFTSPALFGTGVYSEIPLVFLTEAAILAFPSGRLDGWVERGILIFTASTFFVGRTAVWLTSPHSAPWFSISRCRDDCPTNGGAIWSPPEWSPQLVSGVRAAVMVTALATAGLLVWKFVNGSPPRRRALAIGAPIALLYLLLQATYQGLQLFTPANASAAEQPIKGGIDWAFAGARSAVWYGFLFALIGAQLFAGRVLREVVGASMRQPSVEELERLLRVPLGDPGLRIGFWRARERDFAGAQGEPLVPSPRQALTTVERDGRSAAAILHDVQLSDDPELLAAAGGVALLAAENTELERAWNASLRELSASRARLTEASDRERRKLERDLHDGAQQRLMAIQVRLGLAQDRTQDQRLAEELEAIGVDAKQAVEELRALAHGIYPPALRTFGLAEGLRSFAMKAPISVTVEDAGIGRLPRTVETAIYFCATEAVQNAIKHAGDGARVTVRLGRDGDCARFTVADDGVGTAEPASWDGQGVIGMRDRIGAVGGDLEIVSSPGAGTTVRGTVPLEAVIASGARDGGG